MHDQPIGLCRCGCGRKTSITKQNIPERGIRLGEPRHYVMGHNRRKGPHDYCVDPETGCWIWERATYTNGYGVAWHPEAKTTVPAHRLYFERHKGPIPEGLHIDHLCRVRRCVNPEHLEAVTLAENNRRSAGKLTTEEVAIVRGTPRTYGSRVGLARRFGVSGEAIDAIRAGRSWT